MKLQNIFKQSVSSFESLKISQYLRIILYLILIFTFLLHWTVISIRSVIDCIFCSFKVLSIISVISWELSLKVISQFKIILFNTNWKLSLVLVKCSIFVKSWLISSSLVVLFSIWSIISTNLDLLCFIFEITGIILSGLMFITNVILLLLWRIYTLNKIKILHVRGWGDSQFIDNDIEVFLWVDFISKFSGVVFVIEFVQLIWVCVTSVFVSQTIIIISFSLQERTGCRWGFDVFQLT